MNGIKEKYIIEKGWNELSKKWRNPAIQIKDLTKIR